MENGKMAVVPPVANGYGFGSTEFHVLRPNDEVDSKYLYYYVSSKQFRGESERHMTGAVGQRRVPASYLKDCLIPIAPPEQQRAIVAEIEKQFSHLDEAVANLKLVKANLKRYKAAVLKAAVEGKLTEEWRKAHPDVEPASKLLDRILAERRAKWEEAELAKMEAKGKEPKNDTWKKEYKQPKILDEMKLPRLPKGWNWSALEVLGDVVGGLTKNKQREGYEKKLPYLRVANVYANELRLDEIKKIGVNEQELDKAKLMKNDILIVEGNGSPDQIGRLAIWDGSIYPCVHQNHLIRVRLFQLSSARWTVLWLRSPVGRQFIGQVASSTSGLYTLSISKVGSLPIPMPPLAERGKILALANQLLSVVESLEQEIARCIRRAVRLRSAILEKAFKGCRVA